MFNTIVQKWNLLVAKWKEYHQLCQAAANAWKKFDTLRADVTVSYNTSKNNNIKSCIQTECVDIPQLRGGGIDDMGGTVFIRKTYCAHFKCGIGDVPTAQCVRVSCPCYTKHCNLVAAAAEYNGAVQRRRRFWFGGNSDVNEK